MLAAGAQNEGARSDQSLTVLFRLDGAYPHPKLSPRPWNEDNSGQIDINEPLGHISRAGDGKWWHLVILRVLNVFIRFQAVQGRSEEIKTYCRQRSALVTPIWECCSRKGLEMVFLLQVCCCLKAGSQRCLRQCKFLAANFKSFRFVDVWVCFVPHPHKLMCTGSICKHSNCLCSPAEAKKPTFHTLRLFLLQGHQGTPGPPAAFSPREPPLLSPGSPTP